MSLRQPLIHLEEAGDAIGFGETFDGEVVGGHDDAVVALMGTAQFGRYVFVLYVLLYNPLSFRFRPLSF